MPSFTKAEYYEGSCRRSLATDDQVNHEQSLQKHLCLQALFVASLMAASVPRLSRSWNKQQRPAATNTKSSKRLYLSRTCNINSIGVAAGHCQALHKDVKQLQKLTLYECMLVSGSQASTGQQIRSSCHCAVCVAAFWMLGTFCT